MSRRATIELRCFVSTSSRFPLKTLLRRASSTAPPYLPTPRAARWPVFGAAVTTVTTHRRRAEPTNATTSRSSPARIWPRGHAPGTVFCLISASHVRRNGSMRSATPVSPTGTQPLLTTMAPRSCLPMNGAEACGHVAALMTRSPGAPTPSMTSSTVS